jgi:DNA replication protein DnaC
MSTLKQENAMEDAAIVSEGIVKLFHAANMPHLAHMSLYLGIPHSVLLKLYEALSLQRSEDNDRKFLNRMHYAGILKERTENTFKWDDTTYPLAESDLIELTLSLDFIRQKKNLIMFGPPGVGKTLLAVIIACKAIREDFSVKYKTAHDLVTELHEARVGNSLSGYIKKMQARDVLVIEDLTFSTLEIKVAQSFFSIIDKRYGRKTTIVTTNGDVKKWIEKFPDKSMCTALIGRLYEDAILLNMNGATDMRLKQSGGVLDNTDRE